MTGDFRNRATAFVHDLDQRVGPELLYRSVVDPYHPDTGLHRPDVSRMLTAVECWAPRHMVEIGTHYGVLASVFGMVCGKVTTFNLMLYRQWIVPAIFRIAGVDNVTELLPWNDAEKAEMLDGLDFDAAFIDGTHTYQAAQFDFAHVRKCGKVIFHDYSLTRPPRPEVKKFVDDLAASGDGRVTTDDMFAYWEHVPCGS